MHSFNISSFILKKKKHKNNKLYSDPQENTTVSHIQIDSGDRSKVPHFMHSTGILAVERCQSLTITIESYRYVKSVGDAQV